jgi:predicted transcriptional regulator
MVEHPDPGFSATEVGEEFDKTRQWADSRLDMMCENGLLRKKKGGQRSKWFWPCEKGKRTLREARASAQDPSQ